MAGNMTTEKVANVFSKIFNPLRLMTKPQIEKMWNDSLHGADVKLQVLFSQIEVMAPIYQVCINKRTAGVLGREWDVVPEDESPDAKKQAAEVKRTLQKCDMRNEDGLTDAVKHLCMSAFRGRAAVKPFFDERGDLFLKRLDNWNLLRYQGNFYWNPSSEETGWFDAAVPPQVIPLPKSEICYLTDDKPIDVPGLMIYLRQLVGEEQWARFVEKQGVPQVIITAPEGTPDQNLGQWNLRALQIFEGGSGTLPFGSKVDQMTDARNQDPFTEYVRHQMEMISIMSTGGTLLTLGGSTGLGSNLAEVQQKSFESIVSQDCKRISNAVTEGIVPKICKALGWKKQLCRFTFVEDSEYGPQEYLDFAKTAMDMGMKIDLAEFKRLSKLNFIVEDETWSPGEPEKPAGEWTPKEEA